jgi:hypothetical protein
MSFIVKKQFCVNCFFAAVPGAPGQIVAPQTMDRTPAKAIPAFQGHGNVILRFKPAAASAGMNGAGDVEEQQRLQGRLQQVPQAA